MLMNKVSFSEDVMKYFVSEFEWYDIMKYYVSEFGEFEWYESYALYTKE